MPTPIDNNLALANLNSQTIRQEQALKTQLSPQEREKVRELAADFESIFLEIMLKSMRDTVQKSEVMDGGHGEEVFRSMLDSEYAKIMSRQKNGGPHSLSEAIARELLQKFDTSAPAIDKSIQAAKGAEAYKQQAKQI